MTIAYRDPCRILAHSGPIIVGVISSSSSSAETGLEQFSVLLDTLLARYPTVSILLAVEHGADKPGPDERRYISTALDRYGDRIVLGYAFCGLGFWASAMQLVLVGISRLAGSSVIAHNSVEATAQHIARELVGIDADEMTTLCEQLRAELRAEQDAGPRSRGS